MSLGIGSGSHGGLSPGGSASAVWSFSSIEHEHAGRPVDRGVVVLGEQCPASALQALDDVDLPQRADAVHRPTDDAGDLFGQLVDPAGRRQAHWRMWKSRSKLGSSIQYGWSRSKRHLDDPPAHRLQLADLRGEAGVDRGVGVERGARSLVDAQPVDVAERGRRLHVQEAAVEPGELLHAVTPFVRSVDRHSVADRTGPCDSAVRETRRPWISERAGAMCEVSARRRWATSERHRDARPRPTSAGCRPRPSSSSGRTSRSCTSTPSRARRRLGSGHRGRDAAAGRRRRDDQPDGRSAGGCCSASGCATPCMRHLEKDLGPLALPRLPADPTPFTIVEYFPDPDRSGFHDPRHHAVSLAYVVPCRRRLPAHAGGPRPGLVHACRSRQRLGARADDRRP